MSESQAPPPPKERKVKPYQRLVNGQVVQVDGYGTGGEKETPNQKVAKKALEVPGRPQIAARPGAYSRGRSMPFSKPGPENFEDS